MNKTNKISHEEPECSSDDGHDWQSPHDLVGWTKENPGVWSRGAVATITEVCVLCGCARVTDTWATDPWTGIQGPTSVSYQRDQYADEIRSRNAREAETCTGTWYEQCDCAWAIIAANYPSPCSACRRAEEEKK